MAPIPIYDGTNYKIWSVKMKTLFLSMDLWDTVQTGYNDETNKEMQKKDAAALFHIQQGLSDRIFLKIKDAKTAKEAWEMLSQLSTKIHHPYSPPDIVPPGLQGSWLPSSPRSLPTGSQGSSPPSSPRSLPPGPQGRLPPSPPPGPLEISRQSVNMREAGANHLIVATLIATVAFTAGFTMPGGYNGNDGPNQGMAILTREAAFKAFMVTDAMAVSLSFSAVLIYFYLAIVDDKAEVKKLVFTAAYLLIYAAIAMVLAFVTGTYAVLAHSSGLAISVSVIGSLSLLVFVNTDIMKKVFVPSAKAISNSFAKVITDSFAFAKAITDRFAKAIASCIGSEPRGATPHQQGREKNLPDEAALQHR